MTAIALAGAGLVGKRHLQALRSTGLTLSSIIDPDPDAAAIAAEWGVPYFSNLTEALALAPDGMLLATPNALHVEGAMACIEAGVPVLIEKPITTELGPALALTKAAEAAGVPILTGHHRRHLPVIKAAKVRIETGELGELVAAHAMFWLAKPDSYYETAWRRSADGGPVFINIIHDIDLLRYLLGEVVSVQAISTNRLRSNATEDACAALLTFASGLLCTVQISDAIVAPWSFELTAHDNPVYPPTDQNAMWIGGTLGSLALPRGEEWSDGGRRDWWQPIHRTSLLRDNNDPLVAQLEDFAAVIRGEAEPVCSGVDGMKSLAVVLAIKRAAATGQAVAPGA